jgi:hypothetical protein
MAVLRHKDIKASQQGARTADLIDWLPAALKLNVR